MTTEANGSVAKATDTTTPPVNDGPPGHDNRPLTVGIFDARGILEDATQHCSFALMALVAGEEGYDATEQVTKALYSIVTASSDLERIEIACGHAGSPDAKPSIAPESGTQKVAPRAAAGADESILDAVSRHLDDLDVELHNVENEIGGEAHKRVQAAASRATTAVQHVRRLVAGMRSDTREVGA